MNAPAFLEIADRWLAAHGLEPARQDGEAAFRIQTSFGHHFLARLDGEGSLQRVASPGYAPQHMRESLAKPMDGESTPPAPDALTPLLGWQGEDGTAWQAAIRLEDGLVVLRADSVAPGSDAHWADMAAAFEQVYQRWQAGLAQERVAFGPVRAEPPDLRSLAMTWIRG